MTIGEQIIAAINENRLVHDATDYRYAVPLYKNKWHENAQYLLDAMVDAHVAERVKAELELARQILQERLERSTYFIRKDGKLVFLAIKKGDDGEEYVDMDDEILLVNNPKPA